MLGLKNKFLIALIVIISTTNFVLAQTNKEYLLNKIDTLETNLVTLKTNSSKDLEDKVFALSKSFDDLFITLWYDTKTINYLVSLWKISSNFKEDLSLELNTLNKEITNKTTAELNSLSTIKNNIRLNYSTVSDSEKVALENSIKNIESNYTNLSKTFAGKIITLNTKYTSVLKDYEIDIKNIYNSNTTTIATLNDFSTKYENLFSVYSQFDSNYQKFKDTYLAFAWELTLFSEEKQKYYVDVLRKELEKIRDINIERNKWLENHRLDINRLIEILVQNFENSLILKINDSYWVIYSDTDISSIISRFNTIKNRYYDLDWRLKASEVISNTWSLEELNFVFEKLNIINSKIANLLWTWTTSNSLSNVKIRLENEMIRFYNENYQGYREDLLLKLKEKLNIIALEAKNVILAADTIDLRFSLLNDKISKSNDINYINEQIANFKKDVAKYSYLNNSALNLKLSNLNANLWVFIVQKELAQFKYNKMSQAEYKAQLDKILPQLKAKYPQSYISKLETLIVKIDKLLENPKLNDKTRFVLLTVKLNVLNFIKN